VGNNNMNSNTLKIYTLGQFTVMRGGINLTKEYARSIRPWLLFQFLIAHSGRELPGEYIIENLWPETRVKDPQHSLRNLVYRLRRFLGDQNRTEHYIIYTQGNYSFNTKADYWFDVNAIEDLFDEAFSLPDENPAKIELLREAFNLYNGEFLPSRPYEEWTINTRNYCQRIFLKTVVDLCRLLQKKGRWDEVISVCERALEFEPFEENLHRDYVEALIRCEQKVKAKNHYHQTNSFFQEEVGVELSFDIEELVNNSHGNGQNSVSSSWNEFGVMLEEKAEDEGAFVCGGESFRMIYQLEERRAERNIRESSLASLRLIPPPGKKVPEEVEKENARILQKALKKNLRRGDVICPCSPGEFVLLLVDVKPEKVDEILERIAEKYYEENPHAEFRVNIRQRPLVKGETIKK